MVDCYLGVGSNLGKRRKNIRGALDYLKNSKGIKIEKVSRIYETEAVGGPAQGKFLNAAIKIQTSLSPIVLFKTLKRFLVPSTFTLNVSSSLASLFGGIIAARWMAASAPSQAVETCSGSVMSPLKISTPLRFSR
jgi:hypothetical protein